MDPRNKNIDLDSLMYKRPDQLTEEDIQKQEGGYIYRYRYNGGGASQIWLGSGRYIWFKSDVICSCYAKYYLLVLSQMG